LHLDPHISKLLKQASINKSNPRYLLQKSLKDIEDLEKEPDYEDDQLEEQEEQTGEITSTTINRVF
jgi:hypothetical protein